MSAWCSSVSFDTCELSADFYSYVALEDVIEDGKLDSREQGSGFNGSVSHVKEGAENRNTSRETYN